MTCDSFSRKKFVTAAFWRVVAYFCAIFALSGAAFAQTSFTRSDTTGTSNIVDDSCFTNFASKTINVTDTGFLSSLDVGVVADHDYRGALQVQLISPQGTNRTIINGVGAGAQDLNVRLRDGETTIAGNAHPALTSYADTANLRGPSNPLSAYDDESVTGDWELRICDSDAFNDVGSLREFYLHMTTYQNTDYDLSLDVNPTSATRSPGQETSFTLTVSNNGPGVASGVSVDAFLPTGLAHVSNDGGGEYNVVTGLWTIAGDIAVGSVKTLTIVTSASASGSGGFTSEIVSSGAFDPDSTPNNVGAQPNEDDTATANVTLVPPQAAPPAPLSCAAPGMMAWPGRTWGAGDLTNSYTAENVPFDFTFSNDTGFFVNNAAFGGQTPLLSTLLTGGQPSATSLLYVVNFDNATRQTDLSFTVGAPGEGVDSLQFGMFDVDENPDTTTNVNFIDRMTVTASLGGVAVPVLITESTSNIVSGNVITGIAAAASDASDGNMWVTISQPVDTVTIEYDNDPAVVADPGQQGVGVHTIEFCPKAPDLTLSKVVDNSAPVTGADVIYTITVQNEGTEDATAVDVTDLLPTGVSYVSDSPSQGSYDDATGLWSVGTLTPTSTATLAITATVTAASGTVTNASEVTGMGEPDLDSTPNDGKGDDHDTADISVTTAAPQLLSEKTVEVYDPAGTGDQYAIPGNDVIYSISITNSGNIAIDNNSLFLVDNFPSDIVFYNGDIDGAGPETDPVIMETTGTPGITFDYNNDVRFSDSTTAPANIGQCSYSAAANSYDPNVRFICFKPQGSFAATDPDSTIVIKFRARIPAN